MRSLRSLATSAVLFLASLGFMAVTPGEADAQYYRWYGTYNYPYYWQNYNVYNAYNPYFGSNYRMRSFYRNYPYYSWYRSYPWGGYY